MPRLVHSLRQSNPRQLDCRNTPATPATPHLGAHGGKLAGQAGAEGRVNVLCHCLLGLGVGDKVLERAHHLLTVVAGAVAQAGGGGAGCVVRAQGAEARVVDRGDDGRCSSRRGSGQQQAQEQVWQRGRATGNQTAA